MVVRQKNLRQAIYKAFQKTAALSVVDVEVVRLVATPKAYDHRWSSIWTSSTFARYLRAINRAIGAGAYVLLRDDLLGAKLLHVLADDPYGSDQWETTTFGAAGDP